MLFDDDGHTTADEDGPVKIKHYGGSTHSSVRHIDSDNDFAITSQPQSSAEPMTSGTERTARAFEVSFGNSWWNCCWVSWWRTTDDATDVDADFSIPYNESSPEPIYATLTPLDSRSPIGTSKYEFNNVEVSAPCNGTRRPLPQPPQALPPPPQAVPQPAPRAAPQTTPRIAPDAVARAPLAAPRKSFRLPADKCENSDENGQACAAPAHPDSSNASKAISSPAEAGDVRSVHKSILNDGGSTDRPTTSTRSRSGRSASLRKNMQSQLRQNKEKIKAKPKSRADSVTSDDYPSFAGSMESIYAEVVRNGDSRRPSLKVHASASSDNVRDTANNSDDRQPTSDVSPPVTGQPQPRASQRRSRAKEAAKRQFKERAMAKEKERETPPTSDLRQRESDSDYCNPEGGDGPETNEAEAAGVSETGHGDLMTMEETETEALPPTTGEEEKEEEPSHVCQNSPSSTEADDESDPLPLPPVEEEGDGGENDSIVTDEPGRDNKPPSLPSSQENKPVLPKRPQVSQEDGEVAENIDEDTGKNGGCSAMASKDLSTGVGKEDFDDKPPVAGNADNSPVPASQARSNAEDDNEDADDYDHIVRQ